MGVVCLNYMKVESFNKNLNDFIELVEVLDIELNKKYIVKGKVIINVIGIFIDFVVKMYNLKYKKIVIFS